MSTAVKQDSIFVRIDAEDKKEVDAICKDMGITPATAAKMFFKQLIQERALPFKPKAKDIPWALKCPSDKELAESILEAEEDFKNGDYYTEEEFRELIKDI